MSIDWGKCALCDKPATESINLAAGAAAVVPIYGTGMETLKWSPRCQEHGANPGGFCTNPEHAAMQARLDAYAALEKAARAAYVIIECDDSTNDLHKALWEALAALGNTPDEDWREEQEALARAKTEGRA